MYNNCLFFGEDYINKKNTKELHILPGINKCNDEYKKIYDNNIHIAERKKIIDYKELVYNQINLKLTQIYFLNDKINKLKNNYASYTNIFIQLNRKIYKLFDNIDILNNLEKIKKIKSDIYDEIKLNENFLDNCIFQIQYLKKLLFIHSNNFVN